MNLEHGKYTPTFPLYCSVCPICSKGVEKGKGHNLRGLCPDDVTTTCSVTDMAEELRVRLPSQTTAQLSFASHQTYCSCYKYFKGALWAKQACHRGVMMCL